MICQKCKREIPDDSLYCMYCQEPNNQNKTEDFAGDGVNDKKKKGGKWKGILAAIVVIGIARFVGSMVGEGMSSVLLDKQDNNTVDYSKEAVDIKSNILEEATTQEEIEREVNTEYAELFESRNLEEVTHEFPELSSWECALVLDNGAILKREFGFDEKKDLVKEMYEIVFFSASDYEESDIEEYGEAITEMVNKVDCASINYETKDNCYVFSIHYTGLDKKENRDVLVENNLLKMDTDSTLFSISMEKSKENCLEEGAVEKYK